MNKKRNNSIKYLGIFLLCFIIVSFISILIGQPFPFSQQYTPSKQVPIDCHFAINGSSFDCSKIDTISKTNDVETGNMVVPASTTIYIPYLNISLSIISALLLIKISKI